MSFASRIMTNRVPLARAAWLALALTLIGPRSHAGDWPQILGPHRDGTADDERLAEAWPADGPPVDWQYPVGSGFAGVAVADGRVVLFHRLQDAEVIEALDAKSGRQLWKVGFPTQYRSSISDDDGPRCVPLIHDGAVYAYGAGGTLHCVALADGRTRWSRTAFADYGAPEGYFGAGSTPIVEGDKLLVNIGGRSGSGLVAFDLESGRSVWTATDEAASYSSPTAATIAGRRHVIFVTRLNVVSIDPENGGVRFQFPFGARGPTVNAATPLVLGDNVFVSASYGVGAVMARVGGEGVEPIWANDESMSSQYSTCVVRQGLLYGIHGRDDVGTASLRCVDPATGRVVWSEDRFGVGTLLLADDKLLILKTNGELVMAAPSPDGFRGLARARIFRTTTRPLPALADGRLYARDTGTLKCLDLRPAAAAR
jgi:outer membrane protein assembly factor BamB